MTLSDLLGRDVSVEWHEAVALVRDVIERSPALTADLPQVPELHQVEFLGWGQVEIQGGTRVMEPVQRLGQMLQTLMRHAEPPVQLRLLTAQATSPARPYESVEAFSEALGFFERPDRGLILQALYTRAAAAPYTMNSATEAVLSRVEDPSSNRNDSDTTNPSAASRRRRHAAVVSAILATIVVVTAWAVFAKEWEHGSPVGDVSTLTARASEGVSNAVVSAVTAISDRIGITPEPAPEPVEKAIEASEPVRAPRPRKFPSRQRSNHAAPLERTLPPARDTRLGSRGVVLDEAPAIYIDTEPDRRVVFATDPDATVYSAASPDVAAPVAVRPHLPRELPPDVSPDDVARVELVILADGTVDSVRLLTRPKNVHDWMLLSAAKAWRFRPAVKDGVPVKYRQTVSVVQ